MLVTQMMLRPIVHTKYGVKAWYGELHNEKINGDKRNLQGLFSRCVFPLLCAS